MRPIITIFFFTMLLVSCQTEPEENQPEESQPEATEAAVVDSLAFLKNTKDGYIQIEWNMLAGMDYYEEYSGEVDRVVQYPVFNETAKALEGKRVIISGYALPLETEADGSFVILSAFPYANCFFCGGAGADSVMDILPKENERFPRLKMDEQVTFKGKLKLNAKDFYYLNYILEDAILASES